MGKKHGAVGLWRPGWPGEGADVYHDCFKGVDQCDGQFSSGFSVIIFKKTTKNIPKNKKLFY